MSVKTRGANVPPAGDPRPWWMRVADPLPGVIAPRRFPRGPGVPARGARRAVPGRRRLRPENAPTRSPMSSCPRTRRWTAAFRGEPGPRGPLPGRGGDGLPNGGRGVTLGWRRVFTLLFRKRQGSLTLGRSAGSRRGVGGACFPWAGAGRCSSRFCST